MVLGLSKPGVYHTVPIWKWKWGVGREGDAVAGSEVCDESAGLGGLSEMASRIRRQSVSFLLRLPTLSPEQEAILQEPGLLQLSLGQVPVKA